jgi:hypothetical protein
MRIVQIDIRWLILVGSLLPGILLPGNVRANEFMIEHAETRLENSVYRLSTAIDYHLSSKVLEALNNGLPLTFVLEINVVRQRDYIWDENVASLEQRYELQYHALTKQYLVKNLNSGSVRGLPTLEVALSVLGTVIDLPILDKKLLQPDEHYLVNMRAALDIEALPVPVRALAYFSSDWRLDSDWYSWPLPF